jgi:pimeloyl-ACP methyl ester carboxylesterase/lysophospholipase L1-like esterase
MRGSRTAVGVISVALQVALGALAAEAAADERLAAMAESVTKRHGFDCYNFTFEGRTAWVSAPATPAPGRPWIWRARFPGYHDEIDIELMKQGWFAAHVDTANMYGSPAAMEIWDRFYRQVTEKAGLSPKVVLCGVSRGGLFVYNFARRWPERVGALYGDTPVMDIASWPGGRHGQRSDEDWNRLKAVYGFQSDEEAFGFADIPVNFAPDLAPHKIPIYHVIGPADVVVPPAENTLLFAPRYRALGGRMVVHTNGPPYELEGHHFQLDDVAGATRFIVENTPLPDLPGKAWFERRGGLSHSFNKFLTTKQGRVVYLGGSITENPGWQEMVSRYLAQRFPECRFEFVNAGISSLDSTAHAFRWREHFRGPADLVFFEAAVNDLHNGRTTEERVRGYEGVVRGVLTELPDGDMVCLHFADPHHLADYRAGRTPAVIADHEKVAAHYGIPSLDLAREVTDRVDAGQFDWGRDFVDLHPSPFGQRLYYQAVKRFLDQAWPDNGGGGGTGSRPSTDGREGREPVLPGPLDPACYTNGKLVKPDEAKDLDGFSLNPAWRPAGGGTRAGFVNCPMLEANRPGSSFAFDFAGNAVGLFITAGPDAGVIEYSVDDRPWSKRDTFTPWSGGLHLPWALMLEAGLKPGPHTLKVRIAESSRPALRVRWLLVNADAAAPPERKGETP